MKPIRLPKLTASDIKRFWKFVDVRGPDECWPWKGCTCNKYGLLRVAGLQLRASRIAYKLKTKRDPFPLDVMHTCDNPPCCNGKHLKRGTPKQNTADAIKKGRMKITEEQKRKISLALKGRPLSARNKAKAVESLKIARASEAFKQQLGQGHPCLEDTKEKLRQANLGKTASKATKKKMSFTRKGVPHGPMPKTTKEKLRQASLAFWKKKKSNRPMLPPATV